MLVLKLICKIIKAVLLLPVWLVLCALWLAVKLLVFVYTYVKGFLNIALLLLMIGTLVWYRGDVWRYIMLGVTGGISLMILMAGVAVEILLEEVRKAIGLAIIC